MGKTDLHEGWGLTYNKWDKLLYATDGSHFVNVLEPNTFEKVARFPVTTNAGLHIRNLNEIEAVKNGQYLLMNVYMTNKILLVDNKPGSSGKIVQSWDMSELVK